MEKNYLNNLIKCTSKPYLNNLSILKWTYYNINSGLWVSNSNSNSNSNYIDSNILYNLILINNNSNDNTDFINRPNLYSSDNSNSSYDSY
jgi:hypothetical protein